MSLYKQELSRSILAYLETEFPGFIVEEQTEDDSYCFNLKDGSTKHFLRVMYSAVETINAEQITSQLEQYAVAATMRGLGDFPVVVTESGCIFGSP